MLKTSPMLHRLSVASFTRICCRRMSSKPSLASPKFISVEGGDTHSSKSDGVNFSLVSYNILAQVEAPVKGNCNCSEELWCRLPMLTGFIYVYMLVGLVASVLSLLQAISSCII
ncbi:hypothetical protein Patl1_02585 [Pistacia atlantica]|uniref:Uncharacterized protein n=1 Tax=Pistacia atlantica TaxID=434234 RepID=A0ACC1C9L6_9ROSI|nr:hypothetical protein Patl1_02585 [Pistacia atlantica]